MATQINEIECSHCHIPFKNYFNLCPNCGLPNPLITNTAHKELERIKAAFGVCDAPQQADSVNHPSHYTNHPSGIECIEVAEQMGFCLGNVIKYIWRADLKNGTEDLEKAAWYLNREIEKRKKAEANAPTA